MKEQRIIGYDALRIFAVFTVFIEHCNNSLNHPFNFPLNFPHGSELFLVLSGFLIGQSIINIYKNQITIQYAKQETIKFYIKRWLRTLPNYYLFLFINVLLIILNLAPGFINKYLISFFVFSQNLFKPYDFLWWESWTFALQEWFYLIFPFLIFVFLSITNGKLPNKLILIGTILLFLILPILYRFFSNPILDYDLYYRKLVLTRFDSIGYGLLFAFFQYQNVFIWRKYKKLTFLIGIVLIFSIESVDLFEDVFYYKNVFKFCFLSFSVAILLPFLSEVKTIYINSKWVNFFSNISFSIYLIHMPISYLILSFYKLESFFDSIIYCVLYFSLTILLAYINYVFFESYFLRLRNQIVSRLSKY
jgi:peptidoglycan/LPS O-acetylase OafA/YrhL